MVEEIVERETKRFCECGCGQEVKGFNHNSPPQPVRFVAGHHTSKERHWFWKGGRKLNHWGYVMVQAKGHPRATKEGYTFEHILVMEKKIGRYLNEGEVVHHINKIKTDNRPENLQLFSSNSKHISFECKKDMSDRICCDCGSNTTYVKVSHNPNRSDYTAWFKAENNKFRCRKCQRKRY